jgi:hypothetical protein
MMSRLKRWLATVSVAFVAGCGGGDDPVNVLETARNNQYTILGEAVTAAGLTATLSGPGPFTVFAPTDAAFAALLAELGITKANLAAKVAPTGPAPTTQISTSWEAFMGLVYRGWRGPPSLKTTY